MGPGQTDRYRCHAAGGLNQFSKVVNAGDQFEYSWQATEDGRHGVAYAVFRSSFAIFALTRFDRSEFLRRHADKLPLFQPADYRRSPPGRIPHADLFPLFTLTLAYAHPASEMWNSASIKFRRGQSNVYDTERSSTDCRHLRQRQR